MGLARVTFPAKGYVGRKGMVKFSHSMLIGATGAITSQDTGGGLSASRNSAGNYTFVLLPIGQSFKRVIELTADLVPNPAVIPIAASGFNVAWFTNNLVSPTLNNIIQAWYSSTNVAADVTSGTTIYTTIELECGI